MSKIQEVSPEQLARLIYQYRAALTRDIRHEVYPDSSWEQVPDDERKLMVTAARLTLIELSTNPAIPHQRRDYYATPGEADWGC